ncbi:MAG: flagella basal body P-ring formation protein FlgA [Actinomycetales bacterium]
MTETAMAGAAARRLRQPTWRDRRLLVGILLVLTSVAVGVQVVSRADSTQPMYAASRHLAPGQRLTTDDLKVVRVRLAGLHGRYLAATSAPRPGVVVLRSVQAGELVPVSAVGPPAAVTSRPVAVRVLTGAADGLRPGALVDVWIARKDKGSDTFQEPTVVVQSAEVVSVSSDGGVLGGSRDATVRLLLASDLVPAVLSAVDNGDRVDVVPVPGSVPKAGS